MVKPFPAHEAQLLARQRTFVNGLLEIIVYPKIEEAACYGGYETEIVLSHIPRCSADTKTLMIAALQSKGYKTTLQKDSIKIEWK